MSVKNPEYDFKWCPGCGDFGVRRALEAAIEQRRVGTEQPIESNVIVAGIGCSGNMVHLLEGPQPYGLHWHSRKDATDSAGRKDGDARI